MIGYRSAANPLLRSHNRPSDIEALQTDVMRFMAILGLCLTAIFALVQTLPAEQAQREAEAQLDQKLITRQQQLQQVQAELEHLTHDIQEAGKARQQAQAEVEQGQLRRQRIQLELQRLTLDTEEIRQQKRQLEEQLTGTREQLALAETERNRLEVEQGDRARVLQQLGQQLERVQRDSKQRVTELADLEQRVRNEQQKLALITQSSPPEEVEIESGKEQPNAPVAAEENSERVGFLLRFASAEALEHLVRSGTVGFTGMLGQEAWNVSLVEGSVAFVKEPPPQRIHEMTAATVPPRYIRAFQSATGGSSTQSVIWGVQLPAEMEQKIQTLMGRSSGGELVIQPDGEVTLAGGDRT